MNFNILMTIFWGIMLIASIISKEDIEYILHAGLWTLASLFDVAKSFVNIPITCVSYFVLFVMGAIMMYMWCRRAK